MCIRDSLRKYLLTLDPREALLLGRRFTVGELKEVAPGVYNGVARGLGDKSTIDGHPSGRKQRNFVAGSAYVLSRTALEIAACALSGCKGGKRVKIPNGNHEDVFLSDLLCGVGVEPHDTRDACGAERFNPFGPSAAVFGVKTSQWYREYSYNQRADLGCCSAEPVCYHGFRDPNQLKRFHADVQAFTKPVDWEGAPQAIATYLGNMSKPRAVVATPTAAPKPTFSKEGRQELQPRNTGCYTVKTREECCKAIDSRYTVHGPPFFGGVLCVPSVEGFKFSSNQVCEPLSWAEGQGHAPTGNCSFQ
eukprot:TRINITY_DN7223_c0_g2_i1.p2 TRINITY_DN7223_c0_g2~~TRINITY_DN7223_c0_g2_i1.p2  ORF type:complete len:305 (-),score=46.71 TRINITY_DN7223_c0_g2_i1:102-1016(-)